MIHLLLILVLPLIGWQEPSASDSIADDLPGLSVEDLQREFETAMDAEDWDRMESLVRANAGQFARLFETYSVAWMDRDGEPGSAELLSWERAHALAETVDTVFEAQGLLDQFHALDQRDPETWERWHRADSHAHEGNSAYLQRDWDAAWEPLTRAALEFEALSDNIRAARCWLRAGLSHFHANEYREALGHLERTLAHWESIGCPQDMGNALNNIALCHAALSEHDRAVDALHRCLVLWEPLGRPNDVATVLSNLGGFYQAMGRYERAIDYLERSLEIREALGDPAPIAATLNNIGLGLVMLGQVEKAISYHERALELRRSVGDIEPIATSLNNLGQVYGDLGQLERAIQFHEAALAASRSTQNQPLIAKALNNLGHCASELGQTRTAIEHFQGALAICQSIGDARMSATFLNNIGSSYRSIGELDVAMEHHERALEISRDLDDPYNTILTFTNFGRCHETLGQFEEAVNAYLQAATVLSQITVGTFSTRDQSQFREQYRFLVVAGCRAASKLPADSAAVARGFRIAESLRSRALIGQLSERRNRLLADADPELLSRRDELLGRLEGLRLQLQGETTDADPTVLQSEIRSTEDQLTEATGKLRRSSPRLLDLTLPEPTRIAELQDLVLTKDQALLEFVVSDDRAFLWVVTPTAFRVFALPGGSTLRPVHERLAQSLSTGRSPDLDFVAPARELYEMLLGEAASLLDPCDEWILVPDGLLGFVPFEVLLTRDATEDERHDLARLPYVLRERSIRYAPSASFLVFQKQQASAPDGWHKDALLFGDPIYARERLDLEAQSERSRDSLDPTQLLRLRGTRREVTTIAETLIGETENHLFRQLRDLPRSGSVSGSRFDLHVGDAATEPRLKEDLSGYRCLHLATHGHFDPEYPWFSGLVLSDTPDGDDGNTGFVNLLELGLLQLDAQLVFLSACETGQGELLASEGIQSVARSFLIAGARSVIATQRKVQDDVAATIAVNFYDRLFQDTEAVDALRQAKLWYIDEGGRQRSVDVAPAEASIENPHAHPSLWAPFVLYGGAR